MCSLSDHWFTQVTQASIAASKAGNLKILSIHVVMAGRLCVCCQFREFNNSEYEKAFHTFLGGCRWFCSSCWRKHRMIVCRLWKKHSVVAKKYLGNERNKNAKVAASVGWLVVKPSFHFCFFIENGEMSAHNSYKGLWLWIFIQIMKKAFSGGK